MTPELWIGLGILGIVVLIGLWGLHRRIPSTVPDPDRPLFQATAVMIRGLFGPGATSDLTPAGIHRHDANLYAAFLLMFRDLYLADGQALTRSEREIVAAGASVSNQCPYCVHIHTKLVGPARVGDAIAADQPDQITDPRQRRIATYALRSRRPDAPEIRYPTLTGPRCRTLRRSWLASTTSTGC